MLRKSVGVLFAFALLLGLGPGVAAAAEVVGPVMGSIGGSTVSAPLPFLAAQEPGCATASSEATPALAGTVLLSTGATDVCTGCSGHNCFFQTVGTRCLVDGRRGLCTAQPQICPDIKEISCTCVVP